MWRREEHEILSILQILGRRLSSSTVTELWLRWRAVHMTFVPSARLAWLALPLPAPRSPVMRLSWAQQTFSTWLASQDHFTPCPCRPFPSVSILFWLSTVSFLSLSFLCYAFLEMLLLFLQLSSRYLCAPDCGIPPCYLLCLEVLKSPPNFLMSSSFLI